MEITFPIRPKPMVGESLRGYLVRLAYYNGYSYSSFLDMLQLFDRKHYDLVHEKTLLTVAQAIGMEQVTLKGYFEFPTFLAIDDKRNVIDIREKYLKVCPECILEESGIKSEWQFAHHTHCAKHKVKLINKCPICLNYLNWDENIFDGCTDLSCAEPWLYVEAEQSELPSYMLAEKKCVGHEKVIYLRALYEALIWVMRKNDLMIDTYKSFPVMDYDLQEYLTCAYSLITSEKFKCQFEQERSDFYQALTLEHSLSPVQLKLKHTKPECLEANNDIPPLPSELDRALPNYRQRLTAPFNKPHFHMRVDDVAQLLNLSNATVLYLTATQLIDAYVPSAWRKHYLFDFREVMRFVSQFFSIQSLEVARKEQVIGLSELAQKVKLFDTEKNNDLGKIVQALLYVKSKYFSEGVSLWDCKFDRFEVLSVLNELSITSLEDRLSRPKVKELCNLNHAQYLAFKAHLCSGMPSNKQSVTAESLKGFLEEHILVNRYCAVFDLSLEEAVQSLLDSNIKFEYVSLLKEGVFVISKSQVSHLEALLPYS